MELTLRVYGLDTDDARDLDDLLRAIPEVEDVRTRYKVRDSLPLGEIRASASLPVVTITLLYVLHKFTDKALDDIYKVAKDELVSRLEKFRAEKNERRAPRERIQFSLSEDGELIIGKTTDE